MKRGFLVLFMTVFYCLSAQESIPDQLMDYAKNGAILFRLPTQQTKIDALKKAGQAEEAQALEKEMKAEQEAWINAVKANYNFGAYYFFYASDANAVKNGDLSKVFDSAKQPIKEETLNFLVVAVDQTESLSLDGLVVLTSEFKPVPKGVPDFVSAYGFLNITKKSHFKMVEQLNKAFFKRYYK